MTAVLPRAEPATTTLETLVAPDQFTRLAPQWDALVRAMPRPSPFLLHGWLDAWWRHHGEPGGLRVHVARRGDRLVGALPLCVRRRHGLRVAEFLGGGGSALADLLLAADAEPWVGPSLAAVAAAGGHDLADLFGLPADSRLVASAGAGGVSTILRAEAPVLDMPDGWEAAYRAKTSAKTRNQHRRRRRQLSELGRLEVEVAREAPELEAALEEAFRLHELRWRDRPEASGFATPQGRGFHRAALRALASQEVPRIVLLRLDGRAIACNYSLLLCDSMYFHELAFDPAYGRFSPGLVTTLEAIARASADGARRVEFLGGAERYKLELADRCEPLYQGLGLAATRRGRAGVAARMAALRVRRRLKETRARELYYERMAPARRVARRLRA